MKLTKIVGQFLLGRGALDGISMLLDERVKSPEDRVIWLIDHYFADGAMTRRLPVRAADSVIYVDTTDEPTTEGIDALVKRLRKKPLPVAVVGIGGGATLDSAKAVSNLLTNEGGATDYQGWDLLKAPGVFKIGVPTLSGTGAEGSRTCVMMNQAKNLKLGMNSDHTVFDRLILDSDLTETVPRDQYFFTGMDTYIHCIESLNGHYRHLMADAYSEQALKLCREVFLSADMMSPDNRERLMVASYLGGSAIGNSFVGLVHPLSAGLSMVFHTHHCVGNCIVMNAMDEFYPREVDEFRAMLAAQGVVLPTGLCRDLSDSQYRALYDASIIHAKPLANALGDDFESVLTFEKVKNIFGRM